MRLAVADYENLSRRHNLGSSYAIRIVRRLAVGPQSMRSTPAREAYRRTLRAAVCLQARKG